MPDTHTAWCICLSTACRGGTPPLSGACKWGAAVPYSGTSPLSGACKWGAARYRTDACARTAGPMGPMTPTPSQWVCFGPRNPNALILCSRALSAEEEEAHSFASFPGDTPFAAGTPARARRRGRTVGVDVGGCCHTPRDTGIIAEQVPGPEGGYRAACGVQLRRQRSGPGSAMLCRAWVTKTPCQRGRARHCCLPPPWMVAAARAVSTASTVPSPIMQQNQTRGGPSCPPAAAAGGRVRADGRADTRRCALQIKSNHHRSTFATLAGWMWTGDMPRQDL